MSNNITMSFDSLQNELWNIRIFILKYLITLLIYYYENIILLLLQNYITLLSLNLSYILKFLFIYL